MKCIVLAILVFASALAHGATHFVAIGDTGKDNAGQAKVAEALLKHCSLGTCNFGMLAGDNIYDEGMTSITDPILETVFNKYYSPLKFPFVVALGNHDYGKRSNAWERGLYQVDWAKRNPQYYLPNFFYYLVAEDYVLVVLDTTRLMWSKDIEAQERMVAEAFAKSKGKWLIVSGHHPYLSNGPHGNAGNYEGVKWPAFISGTEVKKFIEKNICGRAHVYISGHDHNLQMTDGRVKKCNTLFALTGAGASTTELSGKNKTLFQASELGFLAVDVTNSHMKLAFIDSDNKPMYEIELTKSPRF